MDKFTILEKKIENLEKRILKLENQRTKISNLNKNIRLENISKKLTDKFENLGPQYLIIIALKLKSKQTKKELESLLLSWGVKQTVHGWFKGGNFSKRLLKTGIVMRDGKNSEAEDLYSLTLVKGLKAHSELLKKYGG